MGKLVRFFNGGFTFDEAKSTSVLEIIELLETAKKLSDQEEQAINEARRGKR